MSVLPVTASDFFVLRTPSLPMAFQEAWSACGTLSEFRACLEAAVRRPGIREALFVASPDLEATLDPWLRGELSEARFSRVLRSLVLYLSRMSSRPTPFGLFAGCSLGAWGAACKLSVPVLASCARRTRLDMDYLEDLVEALERDPAVRAAQTYRPNSSLHLAAGRWHFAQARSSEARGRSYHLVALEPTRHLDATLAFAGPGCGLADLAAILARAEDVEPLEARGFLDELVEAQVLTSGLHPPLTGPEALPSLVARLEAEPETRSLGTALAGVQQALTGLDASGPGLAPERYREVARSLEVFPAPIKPQRLFQVDLHKPAGDLGLGPEVRRALEEAAVLLRRLSPPRPEGALDRFKKAFRERYDTRSVPLLEALDAEVGLGFGPPPAPGLDGAPLLEGLAFPTAGNGPERTFTSRDAQVLKRLQALGGRQVWALGDQDLAALENPDPDPFPASFAALASLAADSPRALAEGRFTVLMEHGSGPSGAQLLGRFCQGDPALEARVQAFLRAEEATRPEAVFAELVHQPDGRIGNILSRPSLRQYELPYLGVSGVHADCQISPQELRLFLAGDRLVLRSARLGREVVPRLTSAHNHSLGLPVYQFLARLQDQDGQAFGWSWGPLDVLPFLPRVVRGRHVLARARWRIEASELKAGFGALREARGLPRLVVLEDGDNALLVDLDQPQRVETLLHLVARRASFTLLEAFPGPGELVVEGPDGLYCHELVVPFQARTPSIPPAVQAPLPAVPEGGRTFPPGSSWLYLKLYTGWAGADRILLEAVAPLLEATRALWDRWFFIRYADPSPHLRLRFHGDPAALTGELLPRLMAALEPFLLSGLCWKAQVDTYEREVERYGGPLGMPLAEAWFQADSERVLALLRRCPGDEGARLHWQLALRGVDALLAQLGLDLPARLRLAERIRASYEREFQGQGRLAVELGARFRALRDELGDQAGGEDPHSPFQRVCLGRLLEASREGLLTVPLEEMASSLVHMHVNRLLRTSHRAQEFVLAGFLARLYRARLARA